MRARFSLVKMSGRRNDQIRAGQPPRQLNPRPPAPVLHGVVLYGAHQALSARQRWGLGVTWGPNRPSAYVSVMRGDPASWSY
jgi:hypothetical protein